MVGCSACPTLDRSRREVVAAGRVAEISGELSKFFMCSAFRAHFAPQKIHPLKSMRYRTKFPIGNFFVSKNMAFPHQQRSVLRRRFASAATLGSGSIASCLRSFADNELFLTRSHRRSGSALDMNASMSASASQF